MATSNDNFYKVELKSIQQFLRYFANITDKQTHTQTKQQNIAVPPPLVIRNKRKAQAGLSIKQLVLMNPDKLLI